MNLEQTIRELQDALIVVGALQAKQESARKLQAEELEETRTMIREGLAAHEKRMADYEKRMAANEKSMAESRADHEKRMADHEKSMADLDQRIGALVSGFGEFLRQMRDRQ